MADLKDKQIRLVGSQNFAYATGSNYTQGHVHFTTDEHGSIVVNGKVYGTTDASYVYVGSENIPAFVQSKINALPDVSVLDPNYTTNNGYYLPKISADGHTITVTINEDARVAPYDEFNKIHQVVNTFFGDLNNYDTNQLKSYIDTLSEIQEAFDNSYAESIAKSVKSVQYHSGFDDSSSYFKTWITYTTNGGTTQESAYVNIPYGSDSTYGLVKYDDRSIKKNASGQLYATVTDTQYSLYTNTSAAENGSAYIRLSSLDGNTAYTINIKGTGIAEVTYNSTSKAIEIYVPEAEKINYNHHSTGNGTSNGDVALDSNGAAATNKFISSVNLSADGTLTYEYVNIKHATVPNGAGNAGPISNKLENNSIIVPKISFNECGHITAYENVTISGIAALGHSHDEFVWL